MLNSRTHTEYSRHLIHQIMTYHVFTDKNPDPESFYFKMEKEEKDRLRDFAKYGIIS